MLGSYEILDVRTSKDGVDEVERLDDLNYNLKGLAKGGTFVLRFDVKVNAVGTFQFSASVNSNSALDLNAINNTDTIILKSNSRIDTTYVPSVDCPRVTATELDSNSKLIALTPISSRDVLFDTKFDKGINVFGNREHLKGLRIRLGDVSTVLVQANDYASADALIELSNGAIAYTTNSIYQNGNADSIFYGTSSDFTFIDGVLELTREFKSATIYCRPAGKNCRWQAFNIRGAATTRNSELTASDVVGGKVTYIPLNVESYRGTAVFNVIPNTLSSRQPTQVISHNSPNTAIARKLVFTVKSGTAASFNIAGSRDMISLLPRTQGKTTITENRVEVAADATSTDSINSQHLQVIVED